MRSRLGAEIVRAMLQKVIFLHFKWGYSVLFCFFEKTRDYGNLHNVIYVEAGVYNIPYVNYDVDVLKAGIRNTSVHQ